MAFTQLLKNVQFIHLRVFPLSFFFKLNLPFLEAKIERVWFSEAKRGLS